MAWPGDGSAVTASSARTGTRTGPGSTPRAAGTASVRQLALFGGEITAGLVEVNVESSATQEGADGGFGSSRIEGLVVNGQPVEAFANARVELGDWGYAVLLEQAVVQDDADGHGIRGFVTGMHVILTADHGGLPAGSEILVGYAEAAAQMPAPQPPPEPSTPPDNPDEQPEPGETPEPSGTPEPSEPSIPREPDPEPPGASPTEVPAIVRDPPPGVQPQITGQGYVFPVWGPASFSDDFGAPRATTGWHHGNDIFAPLGAPVLAVSDGTLFLVGWNDVGGHRLWLRDGQGNEYYYAHLSAYSPLAVNGARVEAGDVLGFVGATGDAAGTPYHLHFEIHPTALLGLGYDGVVNPYEYLAAWNARRDSSPVGAAAPLAVAFRCPAPSSSEARTSRARAASTRSRRAGLRGAALPRSDGRLHASHSPPRPLPGSAGLRRLERLTKRPGAVLRSVGRARRAQSGRNASVPTSTAVAPPSTGSTAPVRNDDSREARKRQTAAISSGSAGRRSGSGAQATP